MFAVYLKKKFFGEMSCHSSYFQSTNQG